jgi:predicted short-subunit dehydrogenase-like oxidoreductase (DUF2520 family)
LNDKARLSVGLIGPGRAGAPIAAALDRIGHTVTHVSAVSESSINRAQRFVPNAKICDPLLLVQSVDLVLIAVSDDQLAALVSGLASTGGVRSGQFWAHLSGAHGLLPLLPAIDQGAIALALHPAMTFTGDESDVERIIECPFAVTSAEQFRVVAEALVLEIGGVPIWVHDADRIRYHAALTHASNHLNTLIAQSRDLLKQVGITEAGAFLQPLTTNSLDQALRSGDAALTGPIERGDVETVRAHLDELTGSDAHDTYLMMARATFLRQKPKLNPEVIQKFEELLK